MKYLKKVSAAQLISNTGTIIDSMNPGDDQTVNAPSIHAVKDYVEDYVENYSTTEQVIGTWINGKPLYRTTFNITNNLSSNLNYTHGIGYIDYCDCIGNMITSGASIGQYYSGSTDYFRCFKDGGVIKIRYGSGNSPTAIVVHLVYTKTTD